VGGEIGSWVKVTENHHENRMHGIHFGSKHPLHQLLALFSSSRTRPEIVRREADSYGCRKRAAADGAAIVRWPVRQEDGGDLWQKVRHAGSYG